MGQGGFGDEGDMGGGWQGPVMEFNEDGHLEGDFFKPQQAFSLDGSGGDFGAEGGPGGDPFGDFFAEYVEGPEGELGVVGEGGSHRRGGQPDAGGLAELPECEAGRAHASACQWLHAARLAVALTTHAWLGLR